ncbi:MAG: hypothetical protein PHP11_04170 [Erysipelotrichaceae bacterium]|nr:hypothetical protein [Erysipelotrichaceae bacterium]MDD3924281.1 hypothetical protein [Erysipelotrichaceae bacterium]MDD4643355.1 hypothetical protein [Erysipelotrichaceae bacterium]
MKKRKLVFDHNSLELADLKELISKQSHRVLIAWAFDCAFIFVNMVKNRYPDESRLVVAYDKAQRWAAGQIKMPEAKKAILNAHQIANEIDDEIYIALIRAVAQGLSTIHTPKHALGIVFYGLTAQYHAAEIKERTKKIDDMINWFYESLLYWQDNTDKHYHQWADFIKD